MEILSLYEERITLLKTIFSDKTYIGDIDVFIKLAKMNNEYSERSKLLIRIFKLCDS